MGAANRQTNTDNEEGDGVDFTVVGETRRSTRLRQRVLLTPRTRVSAVVSNDIRYTVTDC
jgi:hypothetical protein